MTTEIYKLDERFRAAAKPTVILKVKTKHGFADEIKIITEGFCQVFG